MPHRLSVCLFAVILTATACQQGTQGPVLQSGPSMTVFAGQAAAGESRDLEWVVTAPSYNMAADGTRDSVDDRLTLAIQSPSNATWLLSTRISGRAALSLSQQLASVLRAWEDVPCLPTVQFPLMLEVDGAGSTGRTEVAPASTVDWRILPHPGGDLARPSIGMRAGAADGTGPAATITMDLSTAAAMQRRLARLAPTVALGPERPAAEPVDGPGWTVLFDGTSLEHFRGFKKQSMPPAWRIEDGTLTLRGSGGDIITREQYDDFEFELQWRVTEAGNSGIFFNVTEDRDHVWETGPEMQVLDDERHHDGGNPLTSAGANYALHAPARDVVRPAGEWNTARILVCGDDVTYWLNGIEIVSYTLHSAEWKALVAGSKFDAMPEYGRRDAGHIALQDHGDVVSFRNIRIRDLGTRD